jgi:hypothetical protein
VNLEFCRFFEVIVIDDDYDNDFDDGDLLLMMNSYMQNDGDLMVLACMKNVGVYVSVYVGAVLFEHKHY